MASSGGGATRELPLLKDVGAAKREELFVKKVQLCTTVYRFDNELAPVLGGAGGAVQQMNNADTRGKEAKRQTLMELLDFVNTQASRLSKVHPSQVMDVLCRRWQRWS